MVRASSAGLTVEVETTGADGPLPPGTDLASYRIIQESLTNVARHSGLGLPVCLQLIGLSPFSTTSGWARIATHGRETSYCQRLTTMPMMSSFSSQSPACTAASLAGTFS